MALLGGASCFYALGCDKASKEELISFRLLKWVGVVCGGRGVNGAWSGVLVCWGAEGFGCKSRGFVCFNYN